MATLYLQSPCPLCGDLLRFETQMIVDAPADELTVIVQLTQNALNHINAHNN